MKYKFSKSLDIDYDPLGAFLKEEEISKEQILERAAGQVSYELLQQLKELEFEFIGKTKEGELYIH